MPFGSGEGHIFKNENKNHYVQYACAARAHRKSHDQNLNLRVALNENDRLLNGFTINKFVNFFLCLKNVQNIGNTKK